MGMQALSPHATAPTSAAQRWTFLVVISAGLFLVGADNSILYTALPELRDQLDTTATQSLWIINAYPLVLSGLLLGTGTLGDRIGHRRMFTLGVILFGLGSLAAAFSPSAWFLVAARALLGVGAATMMPATLALIRITFTDERERNTAIGIWGSVAVVGAAMGPVMGGLLLEFFWWGSVFLINVPVVVLILIFTALIAPPNLANPAKHWDAVSSVWAMAAMVGLVLSIKEVANADRSGIVLAAGLVLGVVGAVLFVRRQQRLTEPLLVFGIFKNRIFTGGVLAAGLMMVIMSGTELMTTQRFQTVADFSPLEAGLLVASVAVPAIPMAVLGGANLHRLGFLPLISGGFTLMALGLTGAILAFIASTPLWMFVVSLMLVGMGGGLAASVASTAIMGSAPRSRAGMAASVEEVSYEFGTLISVAVLGSLMPLVYALNAPETVAHDVDHGVDHAVHGAAAVGAYDTAYLTVLIIVAAVAVLSAAITAYCFRDNPKGAVAVEDEQAREHSATSH